MVNAYKNIMNAMQSNQNCGIGLPKCLLEVKEPQLDTVIPFDLLSVGSIQKHQPLIAYGHIARILQRFCGSSLSVYQAPNGRHPVLPSVPDGPEYYTIPEVKSSLYVLRIFVGGGFWASWMLRLEWLAWLLAWLLEFVGLSRWLP